MHITVLANASRRIRLTRVIEIDILQPGLASLVARLRTHGQYVLVIPVNDDVVGAADRKMIQSPTRSFFGSNVTGILGSTARSFFISKTDPQLVTCHSKAM